MFVLQRLKRTLTESTNVKLVLQSIYPTLKCSLKKEEHLYFIIHGLFYHISVFIVPA